VALLLAGGLWPLRPELAPWPLAIFVALALAAPFFPGWGFYLTVISRGAREGRAVALTFDDGPDPVTTPALLALLERYGLPATFFVTGERAEAHPALVREILRRGHDVGNHSYGHDVLLMLRSRARLAGEIHRTQVLLEGFGVRPRAFRPPVGVTGPRLAGVLESLGMDCVTFSCRGDDFGNRRVRGLAERVLRRLHCGAIVLLHDVVPPGSDVAAWLAEVEAVLRGLRTRGFETVPLARLIGRPVMERLKRAEEGRMG
jgi:peptidoglycan/xylan/chitin deacetylase (PgdA/CDA1 family)